MDCGQIVLLVALICAGLAALWAFLTCFDRVFILKGEGTINIHGIDLDIDASFGFGLFLYCSAYKATLTGDTERDCSQIAKWEGGSGTIIDFDRFRDENLAAGIFIIFGGLASGGLVILLCLEVAGVLDYTSCLAKALNITLATGGLCCLIIGVIIMTAVYAPNVQDPITNIDSNTMRVVATAVSLSLNNTAFEQHIIPTKTFVNWTFFMGWFSLPCAIAVLILVGITHCCCEGGS